MATASISRRRFLQRSALLAVGAATAPHQHLLAMDKPMQKIGLQLYTLRKPMAQDFTGSLTRVSQLGYTELEFAGYYDHSPTMVAQLLSDLGLTAPSAHVPTEMLQDQFESVVDAARIIGHRYLVIPWLPPEQRQTLDQYRQHAELYNQLGEQCKAAGLQLGYHNHDFEFQAIDSVLPYDLLLENTVPELVTMELDLYWISKAGQDPLHYLNRHGGRFSLCHVKDMAANGDIADVGSGELDFSSILPAARAAGVSHFFVEHDHAADPFASVKNSINALEKMTF
jgi:sugar phosphate isomerase/epimerase